MFLDKILANSNLSYIKDDLYFDDVSLGSFISEVKSPFYIYSRRVIERNINNFQNALKKFDINGKIFFAVKVNLNREIIKIMKEKNCGTDTTSIGEIKESLSSGISGNDIVFSGVGKTNEELTFAIENNVQINCESINEIRAINNISHELQKITQIAIRINPEVNAHTNSKIATGNIGDKFGILMSDFNTFCDEIHAMKNIQLIGISFHIGSQITDIKPFELLFQKICNIYEYFIKNNFDIKIIDVGGGVGVLYQENQQVIRIEDYIESFYNNLSSKLPKNIKYYFEPGRYIIANAGILISKIIYIKKSGGENFAILNAGMNNLIRPAMYDAYHEVIPIKKRTDEEVYNIAGPICESSDFFAKNRKISKLMENDFVAILGAGSCGQAMASLYNARDIIEEYLIESNGKDVRKIRNKTTMNDITKECYKLG